jgi:steroid 5-alpha reductase family enzyme
VIALLPAVLAAMSLIMASGWLYQRAVADGGWTDVFWTFGSGATLSAAALVPFGGRGLPDARQLLVAALVALWAVRLGSYVAIRVAKGPEDSRYAALREEWGRGFQPRMFLLMIVQAPATTLLGVSVLLAARAPGVGLGVRDVLGGVVLLAAILGEDAADRQMKRFKADPAHRGQVCDTGLWSWSRHPNYLFEALGWFAYPVIAWQPGQPGSWASWIAPVVMALLLRFGTGVPPLEAAQLRSKGDAYRRYQARVSAFLPRPPRSQASDKETIR